MILNRIHFDGLFVISNIKPRLHTQRPYDVQWEFVSIFIHSWSSIQRKWWIFVNDIVVVDGVHGHQWKTVVDGEVCVVVWILDESNYIQTENFHWILKGKDQFCTLGIPFVLLSCFVML